MINNKVRMTTLPTGGADEAECRLFFVQGKLARIVNKTSVIKNWFIKI